MLSKAESKILFEFIELSARATSDPQLVEDHLLSSLTFALHATKQAC